MATRERQLSDVYAEELGSTQDQNAQRSRRRLSGSRHLAGRNQCSRGSRDELSPIHELCLPAYHHHTTGLERLKAHFDPHGGHLLVIVSQATHVAVLYP